MTELRQGAGRLKRRAEFLRVAGKGRKTPSSGVVVQALDRDDDGPARLGFTVTKKGANPEGTIQYAGRDLGAWLVSRNLATPVGKAP